jgi:Flp pilus assembly protein TadD
MMSGFGMAPLYGIRWDGRKFIRAPRPELYNLRADPGELTDIITQDADGAGDLDAELDTILADSARRARAPKENPLDKETTENLQALGYVGRPSDREGMGGIDPKDGIVLYAKLEDARHAAQGGQWRECEALLREVLAATPRNVSAINILALALLRQNRPEDCRRAYEDSLAIEPDQHRVLHMLGFVKLRQGRLDEAEESYRKALAISPRFVESMVHLGFLEMSRGRQEQSEEWTRKALAEDPGFPRAQLQCADLFFLRQDYDQALGWYLKTLEAWPRQFDATIQTGLCYQRKGDMTQAGQYYARARTLRPDAWLPVYNLACLEALAGRSENALTMLGQAVDLGLADVQLVRNDSDLNGLHELRGYAEFMARLEAAAQKAAAQHGGQEEPG